MDIPRDSYPDWFKLGQYDVLIIHSERDADEGDCFRNFLRRIIYSDEDPNYPKICLLDSSIYSSGDLHQWDILIEKSTFVFLFITDNFLMDDFCQMIQDELIMASVMKYDEKWKTIPIYPSQPTKKIPLGIRAKNGISLSRLIVADDMLKSLPIVNRDNISQFDRYFAQNMQRLLDNQKHRRLNREQNDAERLKLWITNELKKRGENLDI